MSLERQTYRQRLHSDACCHGFLFQPHFITGVGDLESGLSLPANKTGNLNDFGGPSNDPFFIVHHTMVDCILLEWLAAHPGAEYPVAPEIRYGHRRDDYSNSFFPLYTNGELFGPTEKFGYSCRLADIPAAPDAAMTFASSPTLLLASIIVVVIGNQ